MNILHNQKQLRLSLIFGILWALIGIGSPILGTHFNFFAIIAAIAYLLDYFVRSQNPYVLITDEFIQVSKFTKQKIYIRDILESKYFAGDYTIKSKDKTLIIDTNCIDKESLQDLKTYMTTLPK